jgi:hypothetical protein
MNAGGVPNTCKSNGVSAMVLSGERVSNALVTCPEERDNRSKGLLIPHNLSMIRGIERKAAMHFGRGLRPIS